MKISQCDAILEYLEEGGTLTPWQAFQLCGTLALHSRIAELRGRGHLIEMEKVKVRNKYVGRYSMPISIAYG